MLLARGPGPSARIPREERKVSVVELDALVVRGVSFADAPEAVAEALRARTTPVP